MSFRSHKKTDSRVGFFVDNHFHCGSEPARDGAVTFNIDVD
ncbi:hypothetical protein AK973_6091 [Pseudomonas brassicacearum]|nr:hypothetical protein AK973_6091 [Pseudomonas brassicacearum]